MTKKTTELLKKYEKKLSIEVYSFEKVEKLTFEKAYQNLRRVHEDFEKLVSQMYHYNLMSEKDFIELTHIPYELYSKYYDKLLDLEYNK